MIPEKVIGFHACAREFARQIEAGELSVADWQPSRNEYDWLGHGIYFWEGNLPRARQWAMEAIVGEAAIIEAEITLGECLDPTLEYQEVFPVVYADLAADYARRGWAMPRNRGLEHKLRTLDCLVIIEVLKFMEAGMAGEIVRFQTVRCPFEEGEPIFPGSMIRRQSHIQVSVRDNDCISVRKMIYLNGVAP